MNFPIYAIAIAALFFCACSNSEGEVFVTQEEPVSTNDYLPLNDSEYPYAGIPRIVIETENKSPVKDRKTEIPAKLQIWGENAPVSEVLDMTIRGRGNSTWDMPKKGYKIEFVDKQEMLGMPADRDWALIANHADKTLMKNHIAFRLSAGLGAYYSPRCEFVELYLNKEYLGVYQLTETIKIGKNRIRVPSPSTTFLVEIDAKSHKDDHVYLTNLGRALNIHHPKELNTLSQDTLISFVNNFESYVLLMKQYKNLSLDRWIDVNEYILYYWVQEFAKNLDANFYTSVYFTWSTDSRIFMGPVWDFDQAFGGQTDSNDNKPTEFGIRDRYWNKYLFEDADFLQKVQEFWESHRKVFLSVLDTIEHDRVILEKAAQNNFKRWDLPYSSYDEAVHELRNWTALRFIWIDQEQKKLKRELDHTAD
jgi:hypothetical protein